MKLLAIETSTDACSVALRVDNEVLRDHRVVAQQHGKLLLPMIDKLMAEAGLLASQLDALVYGQGPGSFTGVRIGVACAQGIALGADLGVVGVSTLRSIAQGVNRRFKDTAVAVCVDARMDEVYFCRYELGAGKLMQPVMDEQIAPPANLLISKGIDSEDSSSWAGSGAERYQALIEEHTGCGNLCVRAHPLPEGIDLLSLGVVDVENGMMQPAELASPVYLRNKVALTTAERVAKASAG